MTRLRRIYRVVPVTTVVGAVLFVMAASMGVNSCQTTTPGMVGSATCLVCHNGQSAPDRHDWLQSPHRNIACETCHGPGYLHVRNGGRGGLFIVNPANLPFDQSYQLCQKCHAKQVAGWLQTKHATEQGARCIDCHDVHKANALVVPTVTNTLQLDNGAAQQLCGRCHAAEVNQFLQSKHAQLNVALCTNCHDLHVKGNFVANPLNNQLCLQCHSSYQLGFTSDAVTQAHIGAVHTLDLTGTGVGRCVTCHLPPVTQAGQPDVEHSHTFNAIPPSASNAAIQANISPVPPNSCSGIMGCHDANTPGSGTPFDVNSVTDNNTLQSVYDTIGSTP